MIYIFILLFLCVFVILFSTHYFLYRTIVRFFDLSGRFKKILKISFAILSFSFILSNILLRAWENFFTVIFYIVSAVWSGMLIYLIMAGGFVWLIYIVNKFAFRSKFSADTFKKISIIIFIIPVIITVYGIINAQYPRLKYIEVGINNLPEEWRGRTAIHISDMHLGAVHGVGFMEKVVQRINSVNPDIIFITGDHFDGTCSNLDKLAAPLNELNPPQGVYFINGNHESYISSGDVPSALAKTKVKYLRDEIADARGLAIVGLDFPSDREKKDYSDILSKIDPTKPTILLYHQPGLIEGAKRAGVNLQLAGHTHKGQIFPYNYFTWQIFGKYHYGLNTEGDYNIYTTAGTGTWGPPMRVGNKPEIVVIKLK